MKITKNKYQKTMTIHIDDEDDYELTDDNGLDFWPTKEQAEKIAKAAYSLDNTVLLP